MSSAAFLRLAKSLAKVGRGGATRAGKVGLDAVTGHSTLASLGDAFRKRPATTVGLGLLGAGFVAPMAGDLVEGLSQGGQSMTSQNEMLLAFNREATKNDVIRRGRAERAAMMEQSIRQNLAILQQQAPDLYLKVAYGMDLPEDAVVIGGGPERKDALRALAASMAEGRFSDPEQQDPLSALVG